MKTLRVLMLAVSLALFTSPLAFAEGVTISVDRESMPAKPGERARIQIHVDIPTSGQTPRPDFYVSGTEGKLTDGRITNGEFLHPHFHFLIYIEGGRARGDVTITYETADSPAAGEILLSVSGGQKELSGLGVGSAGGGYATYRAQTKIYLTSVPGSKLRPPAGKSPFSPTPSAVNPTPEIINRLIPIAILLGGLGLVNHISARGKPQPVPDRPTKEKQPEPEPESKLPFREPAKREEKKKKEEPPKAGYRIFARLRATDTIVVPSGPAGDRRYDYYGDGADWIHLAVVVVPDKNTQVISLERLRRWTDSDPQYEKWETVVDEHSSWDVGELPPGSSALYFKLGIPWEWEDREVSLLAPEVKFQLATSAEGLKTISGGSAVVNRGPLRPSFDARGGSVKILGANPKVSIDPHPLEVLADGWESTELRPTLELFYQPHPEEKVRIQKVEAKIGDKKVPPISTADKDGKTTNLLQQIESCKWTPPFLVQDPNYVDIATLDVTWRWVSGPFYAIAEWFHTERGGLAAGDQDIKSEKCEIHLRGCSVKTQPLTDFFWPVNGMPLFASAWLVNAKDEKIGSPFWKRDPDSKALVVSPYYEWANPTFQCDICDLSQGLPSQKSGCKLPPRSYLDSASNGELSNLSQNEKLKAVVDSAPTERKRTIKLTLSDAGRLCTSKPAELPHLWLETGTGSAATPFTVAPEVIYPPPTPPRPVPAGYRSALWCSRRVGLGSPSTNIARIYWKRSTSPPAVIDQRSPIKALRLRGISLL
jgi:hypothetical protein